MAFERVFDTLRAAIDLALEDAPELRAVAIVTDWAVGATEFPYGIMVGRGGPVRSPAVLHGVTTQTLKMLYHQCQLFTELLAGGEDLANRLGQEIQNRERHIREREAHLAAVEAAIRRLEPTLPGAVGPNGPAGLAPGGDGGAAAAVGEYPQPNRVGGPGGP